MILIRKIIWTIIFSISMAFVESAVVVYLRKIYHPNDFRFPLKPITDNLLSVEIVRELATMFMLLSVAILNGKKRWERFAYFLFCFGIWDIFYYVWLKVLLDWPSSIFEWDILFLIPLPWIGPVIAPVIISFLMIISGLLLIYLSSKGYDFKPTCFSYILTFVGTGLILFSFMHDTDATIHLKFPSPYRYKLLFAGAFSCLIAFMIPYLKSIRSKASTNSLD